MQTISDIINVFKGIITNWLRKYNIPIRSRGGYRGYTGI